MTFRDPSNHYNSVILYPAVPFMMRNPAQEHRLHTTTLWTIVTLCATFALIVFSLEVAINSTVSILRTCYL